MHSLEMSSSRRRRAYGATYIQAWRRSLSCEMNIQCSRRLFILAIIDCKRRCFFLEPHIVEVCRTLAASACLICEQSRHQYTRIPSLEPQLLGSLCAEIRVLPQSLPACGFCSSCRCSLVNEQEAALFSPGRMHEYRLEASVVRHRLARHGFIISSRKRRSRLSW